MALKKEAKKKGPVRKALRYIFLGLLLAATAFFAFVWFSPVGERDPWEFVPQEAVYVIEADDPIENWEDLSGTDIWNHLKKNELFADIEEDANYLDTLIQENKKLFNLIAGKKLLIVAQMTKVEDYDFIYLMNLEEGAKVTFFMDIFKPILGAAGYPIKNEDFGGGQAGYSINDGTDNIYLAFAENILIASYSKKLLLNVIESGKKPFYPKDKQFQRVRDGAYDEGNRSSVGKFHLNFDQLDEYMTLFTDEITGTVLELSKTLSYVSFDIKTEDEFVELKGYIAPDTSEISLATVLLDQKTSEIRASKILPTNTSFLLTIDYDDFDHFYGSIANLMGENEGYLEFEKTKDKIGNLLSVNKNEKKRNRAEQRGKDKDYWDWLGQEIALATLPVNESGSKQAYLALINTPDYGNAVHDLEEIAKKIRWRTPVKFKDYEYRGKEIKYLAMGGFFRLFLGKLFKQFDKPKYVILDEFVVFSNDTSAIHRVIDSDIRDEALYGDKDYHRVTKEFDDESNFFIYINSKELYPFLPSMLDGETGRTIQKNKEYITSFPFIGLQLVNDKGIFETHLHMEFKKP